MKKFIVRLLVFSLPVIFLITLVITIDFFKIFKFQDYYSIQKVCLNREMVTTSTFNHYRETEEFDSFIFGSSRSQAFKCERWVSYLDRDAKPFHFDASGDGIWGISKKVEYIDELGDTIKNALIVVDRTSLRVTSPRDGHLFIAMPCVSKLSKIEYYNTFIKASLNPKFLMANLDYSVFKTYRGYMRYFISNSKYKYIVNSKNCDQWYGLDKEIKLDSLGYYNTLAEQGVFYRRPRVKLSECLVTTAEREQLLTLKKIFNKHNTQYKFIISPLYDQIPMEKEQIELLEHMFGKENICDFSGQNQLTEPIDNYYETSHYRPQVANQIMEIVYKRQIYNN